MTTTMTLMAGLTVRGPLGVEPIFALQGTGLPFAAYGSGTATSHASSPARKDDAQDPPRGRPV